MNRHKIFTCSELNAMAKERGIKYYYEHPIHELRVKLGIEKPIVKFPTKNYSKGELKSMARDRGYNNFAKLNKPELSKMLGIELPSQSINCEMNGDSDNLYQVTHRKFEKAKLIGARARQIAGGLLPKCSAEGLTSSLDIATREYELGLCPLTVVSKPVSRDIGK